MSEFYVSPSGSASGAGTIGDPWSFAYANDGAGGAIQPGDTIWMRGGTYTSANGFAINTEGAVGTGVDNPDSKILWRNYPGEFVSITSTGDNQDTLQLNGKYNWLLATLGKNEGIEVWRDVLTRKDPRGTCIWIGNTPQSGNKILHVVPHDGANGILNGGFTSDLDYGELEIYGVLCFNNGTEDTTSRVHGFYLRHQGVSTKLRITNCIVFNQLGMGIQLYPSHTDGMRNIEVTDTIVWGAGNLGTLIGATWHNLLFGGIGGDPNSPIRGGKCSRNILVQRQMGGDSGQLHIGVSNATNEDLECQGNYIVGFALDQFFGMVRIFSFKTDGSPSLKFDNNEIIPLGDALVIENLQAGGLANYTSWTNNILRPPPTSVPSVNDNNWRQNGVNSSFATWKANTGLGASDSIADPIPTTNRVFVKPADKYNPGYGHVCIFNWEGVPSVNVSLASILATGDLYKVYNVQDWTTGSGFGDPVLQGSYDGGMVAFPTRGTEPPIPIGVVPRQPLYTAPLFDAFIVTKVETLTMPTAISSYTDLIARVASWANRDDLDASVIPDWIAFFEARARRELEDWLTTTITLANVTGDIALSSTVGEVLSVAYNDGAGGVQNQPLDLLTFEEYHRRMSCDSTVRTPVQGVYPDRDEAADSYTLRFYPPVSAASPLANLVVLASGTLPALSTMQTTNRLLATNPDLYVKGALIEGAEFLEHDERIPVWEKEVERTIKKLQMQTERRRMGASPHPVQLPVRFG